MMLFNKKPTLYLQLLDQSLRYMAVHPTNYTLIEQDELLFDTNILEDGDIINLPLLETRLSALVQEKKWKNAEVKLLVLDGFVAVREIEIPSQLEENEIHDYLSLHLNESIRLPFDNPSFEYILYDSNEEEDVKKITLLAYPGNRAKQYQEILHRASLKPDVADVAAFSIYRVANKQSLVQKEANLHTMILQWNPTDVTYTVFNQDRPTFKRHTPIGMLSSSFGRTAEGEWEWHSSDVELETHIEEQLSNLGRFLDFYRYSVLNGEGSISNIILTGAYPYLADIKDRITETLNLNVELLDLPSDISQAYSALYGLSLREKPKPQRKKKKSKKDKKRGR